MPFSMHHSNRFIKELQACNAYREQIRAQTGNVSEFLIYRFDSDDSTLGSIFSMDHTTPVREEPGAGGIYPAQKGRVKNNKITKLHPHQGGGHAEEIFMRSLNKFTEYGNLNEVELFISMIPCDRSSAFIMNVNNTKVVAPSGCGDKLIMMINCFNGIKWEICFDREYTGDTGQRTRNKMLQLQSKSNANVYKYNDRVITCI